MPASLHHSVYDYGGATGSVWESDISRTQGLTGRVEGSETCDVAVVGGGIIGLSTAYHLARDHKASVILIEASRPGWGSTGRGLGNAGLSPLLAYSRLAAQPSPSLPPERLLASDRAAMAMLDAIAVAEGIDLGRAGEGTLTLARSSTELAEFETVARRIGLQPDTDYDLLQAEALAEQWLQSPRIAGALWTRAGCGIDPIALTIGLTQACQRLGVRLFTGTRVREISERRGGVAVRYRGGTLQAGSVVLATHVFSRGKAIPEIADRALHMLFHGVATRPLSDAELTGVGLRKPLTARLEDDLTGTTVLRVLPDRRVAMTTTVSLDGDPGRAQEVRARVRVLLMSILPGLRDIPLAHSWRGLAARRESRMPVIGAITDSGRVIYAGGLDYDSVPLAVLLGDFAARAAINDLTVAEEPFVSMDRMQKLPFAGLKQKWLAHRIARAEPIL